MHIGIYSQYTGQPVLASTPVKNWRIFGPTVQQYSSISTAGHQPRLGQQAQNNWRVSASN